MDGVAITIDAAGLDAAIQRLRPLLTFDGDESLMSSIGAIGESQTRRRITDEKTGPDGQAWPANREGTSILLRTGEHLLGSIAWTASATEAEWGSSWEFAHIHQSGAEIRAKNAPRLVFMSGGALRRPEKVTIPPRPFVGVSDENGREIVDIVTDFLGRLVT